MAFSIADLNLKVLPKAVEALILLQKFGKYSYPLYWKIITNTLPKPHSGIPYFFHSNLL